MLVKDVMTKSVDSVGPNCSIKEAARRMKRHNIGMLPVLKGQQVLGIVTDRDIVVRVVAKGACLETTTVGDIMTRKPVFCYDEAKIQAVAKIMGEKKIRRMPVTDRDENLVGVLSLDDFSKKIAGQDLVAGILEAVAARHS